MTAKDGRSQPVDQGIRKWGPSITLLLLIDNPDIIRDFAFRSTPCSSHAFLLGHRSSETKNKLKLITVPDGPGQWRLLRTSGSHPHALGYNPE